MITFVNKKRLLAYPYLILIALWGITLINAIFSKNWYGLFGSFIGYDFLAFYSGAKLYWTNTRDLYNEGALANLQHQLVGIPQSGLNLFPSPPNTAFVYGLFSSLPYTISFIFWTLISVICLVVTAWLIFHYLLPRKLIEKGVSFPYIIALIFSFYPVIVGLQNGQNHAHTLLILTLITIFTMKQRPYLAGVCAAFLLYKPQILFGWLILWILIKYYKALLSFLSAGILLIGVSILVRGSSIYVDYLRYIPQATKVCFSGNMFEITPVGTINRIFIDFINTNQFSIITFIIMTVYIILMVYLISKNPSPPYILPMILALLFPLYFFHILFYDMVVIIPLFVLWSRISNSKVVLVTVIIIYLVVLLLYMISVLVNFPLLGFLPILLLAVLYIDLIEGPRRFVRKPVDI
jgi:hypothetical protein